MNKNKSTDVVYKTDIHKLARYEGECCGNCVHCYSFTYEEEYDGECHSYEDYQCELEHDCFHYDLGFCEDYE